jgi:hypothetical protein
VADTGILSGSMENWERRELVLRLACTESFNYKLWLEPSAYCCDVSLTCHNTGIMRKNILHFSLSSQTTLMFPICDMNIYFA